MEGAAGNYSIINILSSPTLEGGSGGDPMFAYFGTLKLALSNSVPRTSVLIAKCIGGCITLLLPFLVPQANYGQRA